MAPTKNPTTVEGVTYGLRVIKGASLHVDEVSGRILRADLTKGDKLMVHVYVANADVLALRVDGKKNAFAAHDYGENGYGEYRATIEIKQNESGICHTEYPDNNIRIVKLTRDDNGVVTGFELYELAVISQDGTFYVTWQLVHTAGLYGDDEFVACPKFQDAVEQEKTWHSLVEVVADFVSDARALPPLSAYVYLPKTIDLSHLPFNGAVVEWFNFASGTGALRLKTGHLVFVHWSELPTGIGERQYVLPGESVTVTEVPPNKPTKGRESRFEFCATGVQLINERTNA